MHFFVTSAFAFLWEVSGKVFPPVETTNALLYGNLGLESNWRDRSLALLGEKMPTPGRSSQRDSPQEILLGFQWNSDKFAEVSMHLRFLLCKRMGLTLSDSIFWCPNPTP